MPRAGLTKESVVEAAVELIERFGAADFSMRALADSLNVKTASLYNHVRSMEALLAETCAFALRMQREAELNAIEGKRGAAAIFALSDAYRRFAKEHRQLYRLIMNTAASCGEQIAEIQRCIVDPFLQVLEETSFTEEEKIHWQRVLRGIVHGFAAQEDAGFFAHFPVDVDESFQMAIQCYIDGLTEAEKRNRT